MMKKSLKVLFMILCVSILLVNNIIFVDAEEQSAEDSYKPIILDISKEEAQELLNEQLVCPVLLSVTIKNYITVKKDKGMIKIAYCVKTPGKVEKLGLKPIVLKIKNGTGWKSIVSKNPFNTNSNQCIGGFLFSNPLLHNSYRAEGIYFITNKGKTTKGAIQSSIISF